ncbi:ATP-dependent DNA helicase Q-like SIM isoform X1 [Syzygium oleosum]|uniref:ATP-dependent DNA helicase Q-like SIM isoform X1 n=1 Tax=Syzygium oleosum TaxID=219896 RepID=UPI0011D1E37B|nr:ATP-dependent DNA helicase Q-like SIM isoform X1 [Syzygium oleosum]
MDGEAVNGDAVIAKLVEMGFEYSSAVEAVKVAGASINDAADYILNGPWRTNLGASTSSNHSKVCVKASGKSASSLSQPSGRMWQSNILDHFGTKRQTKRSRFNVEKDVLDARSKVSPVMEGNGNVHPDTHRDAEITSEIIAVDCAEELHLGADWEQQVNGLLWKHFGHASLKSFQREALAAWLSHQDCLVLAATGSGKSLCFQIPALLSRKVVVVISPLISLMHDQCLNLAKHGVSACFLGSGQPDNSVEKKAMEGKYGLIYVCPESLLRLIKPLQSLAAGRGIALFAIDEVHCVSKWGHDFRPDYRRLSVLRENFSTSKMKFLKFDIPMMALTATATNRVREDVIQCLNMSKETKIVLTSFYRSNLRFSVEHSRTSSRTYKKDFHVLITTYGMRRKIGDNQHLDCAEDSDNTSVCSEDDYCDRYEDDEANSVNNDNSSSRETELSVEYLEDATDTFQGVDDWDVPCGEFHGESPDLSQEICSSFETSGSPMELEERLKLQQEPLERGPTIIYVPTRKETLTIAKFLCDCGIKAAAYNAKLSKSYLRQVHKEFHEDDLEVVVATMAFGMGIDKLNVRRIIHYGWPQSLEAYYQEAGRAGRDGKLADCILFANLARTPTLLPSQRSANQLKLAYKMLSDCHRYGMNTANCRAKSLVEYFGEQFSYEKCYLCDVCIKGPPEMLNVREEADVFMQVLAAHKKQYALSRGSSGYTADSYDDDVTCHDVKQRQYVEKLYLRLLVSKIREQSPKHMATDMLWWQGLARVMESKGYIQEGDEKAHVQIKYPELTERGQDFVQSQREEGLYIFPEADMLLSGRKRKSFSTFSEWGKGWADPEIRRQRLERRRLNRRPRERKSKGFKASQKTVRGRLAKKLKSR